MVYTIAELSAEERALLIQLIDERLSDLEFEKEGEERSKNSYKERTEEWKSDLTATITALESINSALDSIADSTVKDKFNKELKRLTRRREDLEERSSSYSPAGLVEKEMDVALIEAQIQELQMLRDQLNAEALITN